MPCKVPSMPPAAPVLSLSPEWLTAINTPSAKSEAQRAQQIAIASASFRGPTATKRLDLLGCGTAAIRKRAGIIDSRSVVHGGTRFRPRFSPKTSWPTRWSLLCGGLAIGVMMGTVGYGLGAKDEHQVCAARERALNRRHQCTN